MPLPNLYNTYTPTKRIGIYIIIECLILKLIFYLSDVWHYDIEQFLEIVFDGKFIVYSPKFGIWLFIKCNFSLFPNKDHNVICLA